MACSSRSTAALGIGVALALTAASCKSDHQKTDGGVKPTDGSQATVDFAGDDLLGIDFATSPDLAFPVPPTGASVTQRGNDMAKRSTWIEPALTLSAVTAMAPDTTFNTNATFPANGSMTTNQGFASVLYVENGPSAAGCPSGATGCTATGRAANAGLFFAFPGLGANPNVVAIDETSGMTVWTAHLTTGGDGVRGTPVIDLATRRIYIVTGNNPHIVHVLSIDNGVEVTSGGWPVMLTKTSVPASGGTTFNSQDQNQHGALLLLNGILYIPFGGEYGDGGDYHGWLIAIDTTTPTQLTGLATQSARSGIWGAGGLASDGTYVFAVTGDATSLARNKTDSEQVFRVSGMVNLSRDAASIFYPKEWMNWDQPQGDLDFGASTPAFIPLPAGSNPPSLLIAPAKAGRVFVLNGANLSAGTYPGLGGELADIVVSGTNDETVYTSPTVYTSASGLHATINVGGGQAGCPGTAPSTQEVVVSLLLKPGSTPIATTTWCAANSQGGGHLNYPPISTTTDANGSNALVWFMNGDQLEGVNGDTGANVVTTTGTACSNVPAMSYPIAVKNRIVVAALGHLCAWSINGN